MLIAILRGAIIAFPAIHLNQTHVLGSNTKCYDRTNIIRLNVIGVNISETLFSYIFCRNVAVPY